MLIGMKFAIALGMEIRVILEDLAESDLEPLLDFLAEVIAKDIIREYESSLWGTDERS